MGVRKNIFGTPTCQRCSMPIDGKAYRLKINGDDACMHVNCVYDHWHKMYLSKGRPLPKLDKQQHSIMMLGVTSPSYGHWQS